MKKYYNLLTLLSEKLKSSYNYKKLYLSLMFGVIAIVIKFQRGHDTQHSNGRAKGKNFVQMFIFERWSFNVRKFCSNFQNIQKILHSMFNVQHSTFLRTLTLHPLPNPQNNEPVPQVLKQDVNLSCFKSAQKMSLKYYPFAKET